MENTFLQKMMSDLCPVCEIVTFIDDGCKFELRARSRCGGCGSGSASSTELQTGNYVIEDRSKGK